MEAASRKETRGRKPLPAEERRVVRVVTKLIQAEAVMVEAQRGAMLCAEWLRESAWPGAATGARDK